MEFKPKVKKTYSKEFFIKKIKDTVDKATFAFNEIKEIFESTTKSTKNNPYLTAIGLSLMLSHTAIDLLEAVV